MTGSPADEDYATLSGYWEGWEDDEPDLMLGYPAQSTTACCPRETIPDSCSCLEGCSCLCRDCDCPAYCECCGCECAAGLCQCECCGPLGTRRLTP